MDRYIKTFESYKFTRTKDALRRFYNGFKYEVRKNGELRSILYQYLMGNKLSEDEKEFVRNQSVSLLKMMGLSALVVLPGAAIIIPTIVMGANKMGIDILPDGFKLEESITKDEVVDIIQDGKRIYVEYINGYPEHNKELGYLPVSVDNSGVITLDIGGKSYTTELQWVVGIDEVTFYEVTPEMTSPPKDPKREIEVYWKEDKEFLKLIRDQGGLKGIKKRMKKSYGLDYSDVDNLDQLYQSLKSDRML